MAIPFQEAVVVVITDGKIIQIVYRSRHPDTIGVIFFIGVVSNRGNVPASTENIAFPQGPGKDAFHVFLILQNAAILNSK
jgi:hypothetical protein